MERENLDRYKPWEKAGILGEGNNELEQSNDGGTFEHTRKEMHIREHRDGIWHMGLI